MFQVNTRIMSKASHDCYLCNSLSSSFPILGPLGSRINIEKQNPSSISEVFPNSFFTLVNILRSLLKSCKNSFCQCYSPRPFLLYYINVVIYGIYGSHFHNYFMIWKDISLGPHETHFCSSVISSSALIMEAVCSFKIMVTFYQSMWHHLPKIFSE